MTRVDINGTNHQIVIDHDGGDLAYIIEKAQKLWDDTKPEDRTGLAFGLVSAERRHVGEGFEWGMGDGRQPHVRAEAD